MTIEMNEKCACLKVTDTTRKNGHDLVMKIFIQDSHLDI